VLAEMRVSARPARKVTRIPSGLPVNREQSPFSNCGLSGIRASREEPLLILPVFKTYARGARYEQQQNQGRAKRNAHGATK